MKAKEVSKKNQEILSILKPKNRKLVETFESSFKKEKEVEQKTKKTNKKTVQISIRVTEETRKKIKLHCLKKNISLQDFLFDAINDVIKEKS